MLTHEINPLRHAVMDTEDQDPAGMGPASFQLWTSLEALWVTGQ